jgi:hypothetical protein
MLLTQESLTNAQRELLQKAAGQIMKADFLNEHCHCSTLDKSKLEHPQYFSEHPHFLSIGDLEQMQAFIEAHERLIALPEMLDRFECAGSGGLARDAIKEKGVFNSYDFHIAEAGPQLIEINTNAAGAMLGMLATEKMMKCCDDIDGFEPHTGYRFSAAEIVQMFRDEFARRFPDRELRSVAIIDDNPTEQFFYPEFVLTQKLLRENGIEAVIVAPDAISIRDGVVYAAGIRVDFIYNRLTDFLLEAPGSRVLRQVYEQGLATVSPNAGVYALYANKANLTAFWEDDADSLPQTDVATVRAHLPETIFVTPENADRLWSAKREWFFKPVNSYGGKGVYRGDKLTTKVWEHIKTGGYIAQRFVAPSERQVLHAMNLKYDVRVYTYAGKILGLMARYYQGQTTNFRTEHGGLATVLVTA